MKRSLLPFGANLTLTVLTCGALGPAVWKLEHLFGLGGWPARAPFYVLQLYIAPMILMANLGRGWYVRGSVVGLMFAIPLALWSIATKCPPIVPTGYLISGALQGFLLARLAIGGSRDAGRSSEVQHPV